MERRGFLKACGAIAAGGAALVRALLMPAPKPVTDVVPFTRYDAVSYPFPQELVHRKLEVEVAGPGLQTLFRAGPFDSWMHDLKPGDEVDVQLSHHRKPIRCHVVRVSQLA